MKVSILDVVASRQSVSMTGIFIYAFNKSHLYLMVDLSIYPLWEKTETDEWELASYNYRK
jgi:hypothetical protein